MFQRRRDWYRLNVKPPQSAVGEISRMNFSFMGGRGPKSLRFLRLLYHLPNFVKLAWRLFWDSRIPIYRKAVLVLFEILAVLFAVLYFINPLDFDFLPVIGKADDIIVGLLAISLPGAWLFIKLSPEHVVREHVDRISSGQ